MSLRISLAGQLKVEARGRTLKATRLAGRQGRVVLAYLVTERDHPVPAEKLAEVVWGATPPSTWQPALRGTVSKVRTFLAALELPAADMLTNSSGCYLLSLPEDATVDVELAVAAADAATHALATGDLAGALDAAGAARRIAGRPLLPGIEGAWVDRWRAVLRDTLVRSLEVLVDSHLVTGRGESGIPPARELVALEPFRESAYLRLLRALAVGGDRGEALRAYERCRRLLAEELGVDPSAELEAAYLAVLRAEPAASPVVPPVPREAVSNKASFVGRGRELAQLRAAWADVRAGRRRSAVIMGEAGIGKSRLTAELTSLAEREGAIVLSGRCDEQLGASYLPLRQALGDYLAAYPRDRLPALVGPRGGEFVRFWPELAWRVPSLQGPTRGGADAERYLLFEAVSELLEAIAAAGPVVLVSTTCSGPTRRACCCFVTSRSRPVRLASSSWWPAGTTKSLAPTSTPRWATCCERPGLSGSRSAPSKPVRSRRSPRRRWGDRSVRLERRSRGYYGNGPGGTPSSPANCCGTWARPGVWPPPTPTGWRPGRPATTSRSLSG